MIKIVAIKTSIAGQGCGSKTLVSLFQLVYVGVAVFIITQLKDSPQQMFYTCAVALSLLLIVRLLSSRLPKICGECNEPLDKHNRIACPECDAYNVYDLQLWSKLEFKDVNAAHKAEIGRTMQELLALIIVMGLFSIPVVYYFL